jgi:hypothetical protein
MMDVVFFSEMTAIIYQTTEETACIFIAVQNLIFKPIYYYSVSKARVTEHVDIAVTYLIRS